MVYLDNTTETQIIYIPRKGIEPIYRNGGDIPDIPDTPVVPDVPDKPDTPDNPDTPEVSVTSLNVEINSVNVANNKMTTTKRYVASDELYNEVNVNVEIPMETRQYTENGVYTFDGPVGTIEIAVENEGDCVEINNQEMDYYIKGNGKYIVTYDSKEYTGLEYVNINVDVPIDGGQEWCRVTITPSEPDAIVEINTHYTNSILVKNGEYISYIVTKEGFIRVGDCIKITQDTDLYIEMVAGECNPPFVYDSDDITHYCEVGGFTLCNADLRYRTDFSMNPTLNKTMYRFIGDMRGVDIFANPFNFFSGATEIREIVFLNAENITTMNNAFAKTKIKKPPHINWSNVKEAAGAFSQCTYLNELPENFDTRNITNMNNMFNKCESLKSVGTLDMRSCTSANNMFVNCTILEDVNFINTFSLTSFTNAFGYCYGLKGKELEIDLPKVERLSNCFRDCDIQKVTLNNTSNCLNMSNLFYSASYLIHLGLLDCSGIPENDTNATKNMLTECTRLEYMGGLLNLKASVDLSDSSLLKYNSVNNIISTIGTPTETCTLTLHPDVFDKILTDDLIAEATSKNWSIVRG